MAEGHVYGGIIHRKFLKFETWKCSFLHSEHPKNKKLLTIIYLYLAHNNLSLLSTLVIFSKFSPSTAGSHFQRTCAEKLKLLHFAHNCPLSVRCPLTIRARTSGRNFAKFDQRVVVEKRNNLN